MTGTPILREETFAQKVAIDSYSSAATGALASADGTADKIATAAFSAATAYGAVVALVAPKDAASPLLIVLPFAVLAAAVVAALYAESVTVPLNPTNDPDLIATRIKGAVSGKRKWSRVALALLVIGLVVAGVAIREVYGPASKRETTVAARLWLTTSGAKLFNQACGRTATTVDGEVSSSGDLSAKYVPVKLSTDVCPSGAGTVVFPRSTIAAVKY
jgi:uncharacterized membrane protein